MLDEFQLGRMRSEPDLMVNGEADGTSPQDLCGEGVLLLIPVAMLKGFDPPIDMI